MKKRLFVTLVFFCAVFFCAAEGIAEDSRRDREVVDISYAFGMYLAWDLLENGLEINNNAFAQGFREILESRETRFTMDEAIEMLQAVFARREVEEAEKMQAEAERNRILGEVFLDENSRRPGVIVSPSGLQFELLIEGDWDVPSIADTVRVDYTGKLVDGTVFDSTYDYEGALVFSLDEVIPGWAEGLRMMKEGSKAVLYLPPELAYGEMGVGNVIAPNSVLIFEVELLEIVRYPGDEDY